MTCHPGHQKSPASAAARGGHSWWMMALCAVPMIGLVAVTVFQVPLSTLLLFGMVLVCPLMHVFMMRGLGHEHGGSAAGATVRDTARVPESQTEPP